MPTARRAVLLVNLGSPAAPTRAAVSRFLEEFLSDRRVVDLNPILWGFLRRAIILPRRSGPVAHAYASIWTPEGSPLVAYARAVRDALRARLGAGVRVEIAMRYGEPSIERMWSEFARDGIEHVRAIPLFPQYSATTTGSVLAELLRARARLPRGPELDPLRSHHADPGYIAALAASVRAELARGPVDHFVWSFHGLPVRYVRRGDPYERESRETARLLARELGLSDDQWTLVWQSRFGREPWLEPAADRLVPELARTKPRILIACPGFAADCLETLEEIGLRLKQSFQAGGGTELRLVPCLNASEPWIDALERLATASGPG